MRVKSIFACAIFALFASAPAPGQDVSLAPNAPKDRPVDARGDEVRQFEEAIRPHVETARKTYPQAKGRFLKGLPPGHSFFITTKLRDAAGRFEQVFVAVKEIKDGRVSGRIWSDIQLVEGYKHGDPYTFPESELIDWTISKPDGTEEGNFVGKFLDTYQPAVKSLGSTWRDKPATPERMRQRLEEAAIKLRADAPIPRVVLFDIAYPHDAREYAALDGHAVVLLTALAQERAELPLKRVYVSLDAKEIELKPVRQVLSEQPAGASAAAKTFGAFRADALYLLPVHLRMMPAALMVDFAGDRAGFKIATFGTPVSEGVAGLPRTPPAGAGPSDKALDEFIRREFPSFF